MTFSTELDLLAESFVEEFARRLPLSNELCSVCNGEGRSSAHLGSFTPADLIEAGEEFCSDYADGMYDRRCGECEGNRVVKVVDEVSLTPAEAEYVTSWMQEVYSDLAVEAQERRMGA